MERVVVFSESTSITNKTVSPRAGVSGRGCGGRLEGRGSVLGSPGEKLPCFVSPSQGS